MYQKIIWINCAKFIAVLAVVLDHAKDIIYRNDNIKTSTFFSVTVLIFLAGMTSFYSNERHKNAPILKEIFRRCAVVFVPYTIATVVYQIAEYKTLHLSDFLNHLIQFDMSGSFYYVFIYIQLVAISPILYRLIITTNKSKYRTLIQLVLLCVATVVSVLFVGKTQLLDLYGGGKYLFGGTFFLFYFLGMLCANKKIEYPSLRTNVIGVLIFSIAWLVERQLFVLDRYHLDTICIVPNTINPPSITVGVYSMLTVAVLFSFFSLMERVPKDKNKVLHNALSFMARLGEGSLYIFLYHMLCMDFIKFIFPAFMCHFIHPLLLPLSPIYF